MKWYNVVVLALTSSIGSISWLSNSPEACFYLSDPLFLNRNVSIRGRERSQSRSSPQPVKRTLHDGKQPA